MSTGVILAWLLALILILSLIIFQQNRKVKRNREILAEQEKALTSQMELLQEEQKNLEKSKKEIRDMITEWMENEEKAAASPATGSATVQELQNEILKDMQDEKTLQYWKDPVLNTLFLRKLGECCESGADVSITGFPEQGVPLLGKSIAEMIGLFSNLFDNAIEACQLLPEEKRWIRITATEGKKRWVFVIENSCGEGSLRKEGEKTWKKNKDEHGIGKDIIYDIVNRNRGWIEFHQENGVHRVEMMLPLEGAV